MVHGEGIHEACAQLDPAYATVHRKQGWRKQICIGQAKQNGGWRFYII